MASILVVEDDPLVRESVRQQLSMAGHYVTTAGDGAGALRTLHSKGSDLLLTDLLMPDVDGIALICAVRNEGYKLPILAMSGGATGRVGRDSAGSADYLAMSAKLGATATLRKPFSATTLLKMINDLLIA